MVPKGSHIMLEIGVPGSLNTQPRLDGYIEYIKDQGDPHLRRGQRGSGPGLRNIADRKLLPQPQERRRAIRDRRPDTYACGFVSNKYGLAKAGVIVAGFDLFPQTLQFIKSGDVTFTVDQQAYLQGFLPVQQMYLWKLSGVSQVRPTPTPARLRDQGEYR